MTEGARSKGTVRTLAIAASGALCLLLCTLVVLGILCSKQPVQQPDATPETPLLTVRARRAVSAHEDVAQVMHNISDVYTTLDVEAGNAAPHTYQGRYQGGSANSAVDVTVTEFGSSDEAQRMLVQLKQQDLDAEQTREEHVTDTDGRQLGTMVTSVSPKAAERREIAPRDLENTVDGGGTAQNQQTYKKHDVVIWTNGQLCLTCKGLGTDEFYGSSVL